MIPKWYQFGCALGISTTDLDIIKEGDGGSEVYMISMLEEWMKTHEDSYTWETLQEALRVIGNKRLAKELEEHRLKDKQGYYHYNELEVYENWAPCFQHFLHNDFWYSSFRFSDDSSQQFKVMGIISCSHSN